ncbi:MAG: hypothetical protein OXH31_05820 [Gammaproteobacteria bacterium]|nr:hypothetical protein [Gammaproteobacteria bacterium]
MKQQKDEPNASLEAYYAAPKTKLAALSDTSKWSLADRIVLPSTGALIGVQVWFYILFPLFNKSNWITDGLALISGWSITTLFVLCYRQKKDSDGNPTRKILRRLYSTLALVCGSGAMVWTVFWILKNL